jgi:hypothetical protein
LELAITS